MIEQRADAGEDGERDHEARKQPDDTDARRVGDGGNRADVVDRRATVEAAAVLAVIILMYLFMRVL